MSATKPNELSDPFVEPPDDSRFARSGNERQSIRADDPGSSAHKSSKIRREDALVGKAFRNFLKTLLAILLLIAFIAFVRSLLQAVE